MRMFIQYPPGFQLSNFEEAIFSSAKGLPMRGVRGGWKLEAAQPFISPFKGENMMSVFIISDQNHRLLCRSTNPRNDYLMREGHESTKWNLRQRHSMFRISRLRSWVALSNRIGGARWLTLFHQRERIWRHSKLRIDRTVEEKSSRMIKSVIASPILALVATGYFLYQGP
jgi:hypothetical protein